MVFDHTRLTTLLTSTMVFLFIIFQICTESGQINNTNNGLKKDLVLGETPSPLMVKDHTFALFYFGTLPFAEFSLKTQLR